MEIVLGGKSAMMSPPLAPWPAASHVNGWSGVVATQWRAVKTRFGATSAPEHWSNVQPIGLQLTSCSTSTTKFCAAGLVVPPTIADDVWATGSPLPAGAEEHAAKTRSAVPES